MNNDKILARARECDILLNNTIITPRNKYWRMGLRNELKYLQPLWNDNERYSELYCQIDGRKY